jgi:hypothetical protein
MASLFKDGQKPPQKTLEMIVDYMRKVDHPVYMGYISLEVRCSLSRTQEMLEFLQDKGVVRQLNEDEKRAQGFRSDANIWMLVDASQL